LSPLAQGHCRPLAAIAAVSIYLLVPTPALAQADSTLAPAGVEAAGWLAGCWEAASADGQDSAEEQWMAPRGGLMVGMSRSIRGGEARGHEFLTIRTDADGLLIYHAEPSGQTPTDFPARSIEAGRLEFVNPEHDFPQKIVYVQMDEDFIHAVVFAKADDADPAFLIPYRRTKCAGR
jgi:hypothetical protein